MREEKWRSVEILDRSCRDEDERQLVTCGKSRDLHSDQNRIWYKKELTLCVLCNKLLLSFLWKNKSVSHREVLGGVEMVVC